MATKTQLQCMRKKATAELDRLVEVRSYRSFTDEEASLNRDLAPIEVLLSIATADFGCGRSSGLLALTPLRPVGVGRHGRLSPPIG